MAAIAVPLITSLGTALISQAGSKPSSSTSFPVSPGEFTAPRADLVDNITEMLQGRKFGTPVANESLASTMLLSFLDPNFASALTSENIANSLQPRGQPFDFASSKLAAEGRANARGEITRQLDEQAARELLNKPAGGGSGNLFLDQFLGVTGAGGQLGNSGGFGNSASESAGLDRRQPLGTAGGRR